MLNKIMKKIQNIYETNEKDCRKYTNMHVSGMNFHNSCYEVKGLGNVAIMNISDDKGIMRMDTLIINPFEIDAPMLSYDCIQMMSTNILYLEPFDTTIEHTFDTSLIKNVQDKYDHLLENNPQQERWYDHLRLEGTIFKKTSHTDLLQQMIEEYYDAYLEACQKSASCPTELKKQKAAVYSKGLIENGGPATDPFLKAYGKDTTEDFFKHVLFGV